MKLVNKKNFNDYVKDLTLDGIGMRLEDLKKDKPMYREEFENWKDDLIKDNKAVLKEFTSLLETKDRGFLNNKQRRTNMKNILLLTSLFLVIGCQQKPSKCFQEYTIIE